MINHIKAKIVLYANAMLECALRTSRYTPLTIISGTKRFPDKDFDITDKNGAVHNFRFFESSWLYYSSNTSAGDESTASSCSFICEAPALNMRIELKFAWRDSDYLSAPDVGYMYDKIITGYDKNLIAEVLEKAVHFVGEKDNCNYLEIAQANEEKRKKRKTEEEKKLAEKKKLELESLEMEWELMRYFAANADEDKLVPAAYYTGKIRRQILFGEDMGNFEYLSQYFDDNGERRHLIFYYTKRWFSSGNKDSEWTDCYVVQISFPDNRRSLMFYSDKNLTDLKTISDHIYPENKGHDLLTKALNHLCESGLTKEKDLEEKLHKKLSQRVKRDIEI